jgi:hypothetical protein
MNVLVVMDLTSVNLVVTGIASAVTVIIPLIAKFTSSKSEAVKQAAIAHSEDLELMKSLLLKCRQEKAELVKLLTANGIKKETTI